MSVCIRPLHLDAVRCPGEPGWVQLSCGRPSPARRLCPAPAPAATAAPPLLLSRLLAPSPPQGLPLRLLHSRSSWRACPCQAERAVPGHRQQPPKVGLPRGLVPRPAGNFSAAGALRALPQRPPICPTPVAGVRALRPPSALPPPRPPGASAAACTFLPRDRAALCAGAAVRSWAGAFSTRPSPAPPLRIGHQINLAGAPSPAPRVPGSGGSSIPSPCRSLSPSPPTPLVTWAGTEPAGIGQRGELGDWEGGQVGLRQAPHGWSSWVPDGAGGLGSRSPGRGSGGGAPDFFHLWLTRLTPLGTPTPGLPAGGRGAGFSASGVGLPPCGPSVRLLRGVRKTNQKPKNPLARPARAGFRPPPRGRAVRGSFAANFFLGRRVCRRGPPPSPLPAATTLTPPSCRGWGALFRVLSSVLPVLSVLLECRPPFLFLSSAETGRSCPRAQALSWGWALGAAQGVGGIPLAGMRLCESHAVWAAGPAGAPPGPPLLEGALLEGWGGGPMEGAALRRGGGGPGVLGRSAFPSAWWVGAGRPGA